MFNVCKKFMTGFVIAATLALSMPQGLATAWAASAAVISFSDPTASVGDEVTVTCKISSDEDAIGKTDLMLKYDADALEYVSGANANGGAGSVKLSASVDSSDAKTVKYTLKFKALKAGESNITVSSSEIYNTDSKEIEVRKTGQSKVTVSGSSSQTGSAKGAALASLRVSPGTLDPAFSADVTSYKVTVDDNVDKLAVSAEPADSGAKVTVTGAEELKSGANTVECKVTGSDGSTTTYTITVNKGQSADSASGSESSAASESKSGPITTISAKDANATLSSEKVEVDGVTYTLAQSFDSKIIPDGFSEGSLDYGSASVECAKTDDMTLLFLAADSGDGAFFIYDTANQSFSPLITVNVEKKSLIVLTPDSSVTVPEGFNETTIDLNGNFQVTGWTPADAENPEYCLLYGKMAGGDAALYSYDLTEKTIQRYFESPSGTYSEDQVNNLIDNYNNLKKKDNRHCILIIVLAVAALILLITVINLLLRRKDLRDELMYYRDGEDDDEPEDEEPVRNGRAAKARQSGKKEEIKKTKNTAPEESGKETLDIPIRQTAAERAERAKRAAEEAKREAEEAGARARAAREAAEAAARKPESDKAPEKAPAPEKNSDTDDDLFDL